MNKLSVIPLLFVFALVGCAAESPNDSSAPTQSQNKTPESADLNKLKDQLSEAGFGCKEWLGNVTFPLADSSDSCAGIRVAYFSSSDDVEKQIETSKKYSKANKLDKRTWVIGDDFIIESKDAKKIAEALKADVETF